MNLYPRRPGNTSDRTIHDAATARRILDRARKGERVRDDLVSWALLKTGDVRALTSEEAAHCVCPIAEAHAGMDEMGEYCDAHAPATSRAPARIAGEAA